MKPTKVTPHKFHVKKGDKVKIIAGNNRGQEGTILAVLREKDRVIVENINMVVRHIKRTRQGGEGKIVKKEAGIHVSNVMVIDPKTGKPTRIGRKKDENGKSRRYSKETGNFID